MILIEIIFIFCVLMVLYVYMGYPAFVLVLSAIKNRKVNKGFNEPAVSILISAYNEASCIEDTIRNKINLDYPPEKMEIIVVSDGSTDETAEIAERFAEQGVRLIRQWPRAGKSSALNRAVREATGEILVFSDANSIYDKCALRYLMENFKDPDVGYVTGNMVYTNPDGTTIGDGCTTYMKYENSLRRWETRLGSIVGVDGGIDAVRKKIYKELNPDQLPDFVLPLRVVEQGYRVIYEPDAILKEESLNSSSDEYRMRVRVSLRALWALRDMSLLLNPARFGMFSIQLWSHKLLRYGCFIFLIGAYLSNALLLGEGRFFRIAFIIQNTTYVVALITILMERMGKKIGILYPLSYFTLINVAAGHAFGKFLMGKKQTLWTPRKG